MPQRDTSGIGERIPRELIDADFGIAFSFIEMAQDELRQGNGQVGSQLLGNAEELLENIRGRLLRMTPAQKEVFEPRCAKLAQAIEMAKAEAPPDGI